MDVDFSLSGQRVTRMLDVIARERAYFQDQTMTGVKAVEKP